MNVYEARRRNVARVAEKLKSLLDEGAAVYTEEKDVLLSVEVTAEGNVFMETRNGGRSFYFLNDPELDNGCHTPVADFNAGFKGWTFVRPQDVRALRI